MRLPETLNEHPETLMSNFDHTVDESVAAALLQGKEWAPYTAWDFYAKVWFADGLWRAEVWCHGLVAEMLEADSPAELMKIASDKYGYE